MIARVLTYFGGKGRKGNTMEDPTLSTDGTLTLKDSFIEGQATCKRDGIICPSEGTIKLYLEVHVFGSKRPRQQLILELGANPSLDVSDVVSLLKKDRAVTVLINNTNKIVFVLVGQWQFKIK